MLLLFIKYTVHKQIVVLLYYPKKTYFGMSVGCLKQENVWKKINDIFHTDVGGGFSSVVSPECTGLALCFHAEE